VASALAIFERGESRFFLFRQRVRLRYVFTLPPITIGHEDFQRRHGDKGGVAGDLSEEAWAKRLPQALTFLFPAQK
jgi:hypothetical protein